MRSSSLNETGFAPEGFAGVEAGAASGADAGVAAAATGWDAAAASGCSCDLPGLRSKLECAPAGELKNPFQLSWIGGKTRVFLQVENQPIRSGRKLLRCGIVENVLVGRKECSFGLALAGFDGEAKAILGRLKDGLVVWRAMAWEVNSTKSTQ